MRAGTISTYNYIRVLHTYLANI